MFLFAARENDFRKQKENDFFNEIHSLLYIKYNFFKQFSILDLKPGKQTLDKILKC